MGSPVERPVGKQGAVRVIGVAVASYNSNIVIVTNKRRKPMTTQNSAPPAESGSLISCSVENAAPVVTVNSRNWGIKHWLGTTSRKPRDPSFIF